MKKIFLTFIYVLCCVSIAFSSQLNNDYDIQAQKIIEAHRKQWEEIPKQLAPLFSKLNEEFKLLSYFTVEKTYSVLFDPVALKQITHSDIVCSSSNTIDKVLISTYGDISHYLAKLGIGIGTGKKFTMQLLCNTLRSVLEQASPEEIYKLIYIYAEARKTVSKSSYSINDWFFIIAQDMIDYGQGKPGSIRWGAQYAFTIHTMEILKNGNINDFKKLPQFKSLIASLLKAEPKNAFRVINFVPQTKVNKVFVTIKEIEKLHQKQKELSDEVNAPAKQCISKIVESSEKIIQDLESNNKISEESYNFALATIKTCEDARKIYREVFLKRKLFVTISSDFCPKEYWNSQDIDRQCYNGYYDIWFEKIVNCYSKSNCSPKLLTTMLEVLKGVILLEHPKLAGVEKDKPLKEMWREYQERFLNSLKTIDFVYSELCINFKQKSSVCDTLDLALFRQMLKDFIKKMEKYSISE